MKTAIRLAAAAFLIGAWAAAQWAFGNGGPFVVKDPHGDPAAKGVMARIDPTLQPAQETRLRVVKEDLTVCFVPEPQKWRSENCKVPPVAEVTAAYKMKNPTGKEVTMDFGFPILRGIYIKFGMIPYPDVEVRLDKEQIDRTVISNSAIYGIIRQNSHKTIEKASRPTRSWPGWRPPCAAAWPVPQPPKPPKQEEAKGEDDSDIPFGSGSLYLEADEHRRVAIVAETYAEFSACSREPAKVSDLRAGLESTRRGPNGRVRQRGSRPGLIFFRAQ